MDLDSVRAFAALGAITVEGLCSGSITIAGVTYPAAVGSVPLAETSVIGGESYQGELLVHVQKVNLATKPPLKTTVVTQGRKWTVFMVKGDEPAAVVWSLHLEPRN
jgi:hypothetical protein